MKNLALTRFAVGAGAVAAVGFAVIAYSFVTKSVDAFAIGGILALAGLQCGMNAHVAALRSAMPVRE